LANGKSSVDEKNPHHFSKNHNTVDLYGWEYVVPMQTHPLGSEYMYKSIFLEKST
jgi:hypothetical protein